MKRDMEPMLLEMYDSSAGNAPKFLEEYRQFWNLPEDFVFGGE
jgi:hypothetical protein